MITILLAGLLFVFISISLGRCVVQLLSGNGGSGPLMLFLTGVAIQLCYFSTWSLFLPTDMLSLVLPFLASVWAWQRYQLWRYCTTAASSIISRLLSRQHIVVTSCVLMVLLAFCLVVPYNEDSPGYHYLSIRWSEEYKVIPGLANLGVKYGTHSSFFVMCAAYGFSDILPHTIYPLNFVIVPLFFCWLLFKSWGYSNYRRYTLWLVMLVLFRYMLINITSPSNDPLSFVYMFFVLWMLMNDAWQPYIRILTLFCLAAITVKLSTMPILAVLLLLAWHSRQTFIRYGMFTTVAGVMILLPWLLRSYFISGYFLFPSVATDFLPADWKVPADIVTAERVHIQLSPRLLGLDYAKLVQQSFIEWVPMWYKALWKDNLVNAVLVTAGLASPLYWLPLWWKKIRPTLSKVFAYLLCYAGIFFWIAQSADIRFGIVFILFCVLIPLGDVMAWFRLAAWNKWLAGAVMLLAGLYYTRLAYQKMPQQPIASHIVLPVQDVFHAAKQDTTAYPYVNLQQGVRLYLIDSTYKTINAPLPIFAVPNRINVDTGIHVTMRGGRITDGFKYKKQ